MRAYELVTCDDPMTSDDPAHDAEEQRWIVEALLDSAEFAPLYERYATPVYRFCFRQTGNADLANDLTAQIFIRALEKLDRYQIRSGATFRSWLFAIARNMVADHWRRGKSAHSLEGREQSLIDWEPGPEEVAVHRSEMDELRILLESLPDRQRAIVELRLSGLTTGEIADAMHISIAAVKSAQTRAYSRIRELSQSSSGDVR